MCYWFFFFFKQKTAYEMRISDWSSDVCSSDLVGAKADREADADHDERRRFHHQLAPAVEAEQRRDEEMVERQQRVVAHGEEEAEAGEPGERDRQHGRGIEQAARNLPPRLDLKAEAVKRHGPGSPVRPQRDRQSTRLNY